MSTTEHLLFGRDTPGELSAELVEASGAGLRAVEIGLVVFGGLLVAPPLLILVVVVAMPLIAMAAVVAALVGAVAALTWLVRRLRAHHRAHGSTLFLHRVARRYLHHQPGETS